MLRGELHNRGSDGRCEACGEIFPCPTGLAIYEAVKHELEHPAPRLPAARAAPVPPAATPEPPPIQPPAPVRWEDLDDRDARCPGCLHFWATHGSEPDPVGCGLIVSSMAERTAMAERDRELRRRGVPPEVAGPQAYHDLRYCGCQERPEPGSAIAISMAREAARQRELYGDA